MFPISYKTLGPVPYVTIGKGHEFIVADPNTPVIPVRDLTGTVIRTYRLSEKPGTAFAEIAAGSTVAAAQGIGIEQAGGRRTETKSARTDVMAFTANGVVVRNFDSDGAAHFYSYLFNQSLQSRAANSRSRYRNTITWY